MSENEEILINLVSKHSEVVNQSLTHLKRGSRLSLEMSNNILAVSKIFYRNYASVPLEDQRGLSELARKISQLHDEFCEFFTDYGKDLINMGELITEIFSTFRNVLDEYREKEK